MPSRSACAFSSNSADDAGGGIGSRPDGAGRPIGLRTQPGPLQQWGSRCRWWRLLLAFRCEAHRVKGFGGGLYAVGTSQVHANYSKIHGNTSGVNGGGLFADNGSTLTLQHTDVVANWSAGQPPEPWACTDWRPPVHNSTFGVLQPTSTVSGRTSEESSSPDPSDTRPDSGPPFGASPCCPETGYWRNSTRNRPRTGDQDEASGFFARKQPAQTRIWGSLGRS